MFAHARSLCFAAVLAAVPLTGLAGEASAATVCGNHDVITKALTSKYEEARRVMGVVNSKAVMEIFLSPKGTWTMVVTNTSGMACVAATGEEWQDVPLKVVGLDS